MLSDKRTTVRTEFRNRDCRGFTLVELLVVIAIIIILMGILLPCLSYIRKRAHTTVCQNNLHQLGIGMNIYAEQNDGNMPPWLGGDRTWGDRWGWLERLTRLVLDRKDDMAPPDLCVCPGATRFGYSCNSQSFWGDEGSYKNKQMIISIYDIGPNFWNALNGRNDEDYNYETDLSDEYRGKMGFLWWPGMITPHGKGHNILFSDGHVGWFAKWDDNQMTRGADY